MYINNTQMCLTVFIFNIFTWKTMASTFFWFVINLRWVNDWIIFIFEWTILLNNKRAWLPLGPNCCTLNSFSILAKEASSLLSSRAANTGPHWTERGTLDWPIPCTHWYASGNGRKNRTFDDNCRCRRHKSSHVAAQCEHPSQKNVHDLVFVTMRC